MVFVTARFVEIPVWRYGKVVAYAKVDPFDAQWLAARRWRLSPNGYAVTTGANRKQTAWMHRELLGLTRGDGWQTDHINGDKLDNRRANLRKVTHAQNAQNVRSRPGSSAFRGVSREGKRWMAYGRVGGKMTNLGRFTTEEEAAAVAAAWRAENMPFSIEARATRG